METYLLPTDERERKLLKDVDHKKKQAKNLKDEEDFSFSIQKH